MVAYIDITGEFREAISKANTVLTSHHISHDTSDISLESKHHDVDHRPDIRFRILRGVDFEFDMISSERLHRCVEPFFISLNLTFNGTERLKIFIEFGFVILTKLTAQTLAVFQHQIHDSLTTLNLCAAFFRDVAT